MNLITKQNRLTDLENRPEDAKGKGRGGGRDWEFGISRGKLVYTGWINSTGNSSQYPEINRNGKESEKEWMWVYVSLNHFAVQQK